MQIDLATAAPTDRWRLTDLYASVDDWHADAGRLQAQLADLAACRGTLGGSAASLARVLELDADCRRRQQRLATYAGLLLDEDTGVGSSIELNQRAQRLGADHAEAAAFIGPEVVALAREAVERFVAQDVALQPHRHPLRTLLRNGEHTLDARGEDLLATIGEATNASESIAEMLVAAELPWPQVTLSDGRTVTVDQPTFGVLRGSSNRTDRLRATRAFWARWKEYERTFGVAFHEMLKRDRAWARVRRYPDSLARALDRDNLPRAVIDTLVAETRAAAPTLHRYLRLRGRLLGIEGPLDYPDLYPPLVAGTGGPYTLDRSAELLLAAVEPLGRDYVDGLRHGLVDGWTDVHPRPRKRSGGYMNGGAYDVHPYLLLNHTGEYHALTTLAHEWGHGMHTVLANAAQPFVTADYAAFTAEIAAIVNEQLLSRHLQAQARDDDERLFYLGQELDGIRGTFFRQVQFSEFEREVHAIADRGEPLSGESLSRLYLSIVRHYLGHAERVTQLDELYGIEWAFIPHFYFSFYLFQYATSIAAAALFADGIVERRPGAVDRYLAMLRAGGSDDPYELVKAAGVDLASPEPYRALVARMNRLLDEVEAIEARRARR